MAVCAWSALDCDNRRFKFAVEKIGIELVKQLFQLSSEAGCFDNFFHSGLLYGA